MAMAKCTVEIGVIVVDVQADFTTLKNGFLAVDGTDEAYIKAV
jgi:nicotinamidase/pyrazinamidase